MPYRKEIKNNMRQKAYITFSTFEFPGLVQAVSTRKLSSMKNGGEIIFENVKQLLEELHIGNKDTIFTRQTHGNKIAEIVDTKRKIINDCDGLITKKKNIILGMVTADCLPIIFYDPLEKIAGIVHAGYKGILRGIIENMVDVFIKNGSKPQNLYIGIGPGIGKCCYDIPRERAEMFVKKYPDFKNIVIKKEKKYFLDLQKIAKEILFENGIQEKHIQVIPLCTKGEKDLFFSYRGDTGETFGEMATIIGMI